jgi:TetR/AcrR family transcriptional repressor of nem operon
MGRKKSYNRDELIDKAVEIFHDNGFSGTSADMLAKGMGVNRYGIYAEFGSKQGLFEAALQRYNEQNIERNFGPLENPQAGMKEIFALLKFFGSAYKSPAMGRGCLLCNTAVEFGPNDPSETGFVKNYFKRISKAFSSALTNAANNGELQKSIELQAEADYLTSSVLGMFVMLRAKAPKRAIRNASETVVQHLEKLRNK